MSISAAPVCRVGTRTDEKGPTMFAGAFLADLEAKFV
jgi:hypothetical protein